jgi:hypothetical protein
MKGCPTPRFLAVMAAVCLALVAATAFAQYQTGNIYGKVQAKDGSVLPGVTVTVTGVGAPQTGVTGPQGEFHFLNLSPGTYSIKAELAGYGTATRAGVRVQVGQSADLTVALNPAVAESITVTAEAPLLDTRRTGTATNVAQVELEKVPSSRDPWTVLQTVPSVRIDRINVGGSQSGQQSNYIGKGNLARENTWNMDGVTITDMLATGASPMYFDFDSFEEMQVTTGGSDPRIQTPGVQLNMVTKRGTNDFKGSGRYFYTPGSLQAAATVPAEALFYLASTNKINFVRDYGAEIGGPVWKDRFWFWAARGDQKISDQASTTVGTGGSVSVGLNDNIVLRNKNLKLNGQILTSNSAVAYYTWSDKVRNARNLSPSRPLETAWHQAGPTPVYKLEDTQIIGSSLYLTGMWSKVQGGFVLHANGGLGESAPSMWEDGNSIFHGNFDSVDILRPQKQYRIDGSKFFDIGKMNHELKFGFGYRKTPGNSITVYPGPAHGYWDYSSTQAPGATICAKQGLTADCGVARVIRDTAFPLNEKYNDFYVGDTILLGNFTVQAGVRLDRQQSQNLPLSVPANPVLSTPLTLPCISTLTCNGVKGGTLNALLPAGSTPGDARALRWNTISPRIGLTYALGADKRTLLRAGYNRYVSQMGPVISSANPLGYTAFTFYGVDSNGDHTIQPSELVKIRSFSGINPLNPTAVSGTRRIDYGMKAPYTDEFLIGGERELMSDFSVGMNYSYRKNHAFVTTRWEKTQGAGDYYTTADYVQVKTAGGTQFTLKDPAGNVVATFPTNSTPVYALAPNVATPVYSVITTRPNYSQQFGGLELTATKRMSNRWMLRANASYNDYKETCGAGSFANPTASIAAAASVYGGPTACPGGQVAPSFANSGQFANAFINAKWEFNIAGAYVAPWDINLGANLNARQGYPVPLRDTVTGLNGGNVVAVLDPVGSIRFQNVYELDLRVAKDFRFYNRVGMTVSGDLFNVPNKRTILQRTTSILQNEASLSSGWRIQEMQSPRIWRLGARFTY